jgi:hypothetical protein
VATAAAIHVAVSSWNLNGLNAAAPDALGDCTLVLTGEAGFTSRRPVAITFFSSSLPPHLFMLQGTSLDMPPFFLLHCSKSQV